MLRKKKKHIKIFLFLCEHKHDGDLKAPAINIQYQKSYLFDPLNVTKWSRILVNRELPNINHDHLWAGKGCNLLWLFESSRSAGYSAAA